MSRREEYLWQPYLSVYLLAQTLRFMTLFDLMHILSLHTFLDGKTETICRLNNSVG